MMKTRSLIGAIAFVSVVVLGTTFLSCSNPVGLGSKLDVNGPVVKITAPAARKAVKDEFALEGTVTDYSGVSRMLIKAELNAPTGSAPFFKQWRFDKGQWQVSENQGTSWKSFDGADWNGNTKDMTWKIDINMLPEGGGVTPADGQYVFSVQAWDVGGFSDDNSFETRVFIYDHDPPSVEITNPPLYLPVEYENMVDPFKKFHEFGDTSGAWKNSDYLGEFLTQDFQLQWQIDDTYEVWSIDLRFYPHNAPDVDNDVNTPLPDDTVIYQYHENIGPPPAEGHSPSDNILPNGKVMVPDLAGEARVYNEEGYKGGQLINPITEKTTVLVVANCYDAAGNQFQSRKIGYFIYWPEADKPWIEFAAGLKEDAADYELDADNIYMIYPGRTLKANAFHAKGVLDVTYTIYEYEVDDEDTGEGNMGGVRQKPIPGPNGTTEWVPDAGTIPNNPRGENQDTYSQMFAWEFAPPSASGYYVVVATANSTPKANGDSTESTEYKALFRVQDITFPDFPVQPLPSASTALFMHMGLDPVTDAPNAAYANKITIKGTVADATEIKSLRMVWINPESQGYATMSQLAYFRDPNYEGWKYVENVAPGDGWVEEDEYDSGAPNKLWKLAVTPKVPFTNPETQRKEYTYTQTIDLTTDLNIGVGRRPLKSQMFLLRAENASGKCTIITYAPQGDEAYPEIVISKVVVESGGNTAECIPGEFRIVPKIVSGATITIDGFWTENSAQKLAINNYLLPNLKVSVGLIDLITPAALLNQIGTAKPGIVMTLTPNADTVEPSPTYNDKPGGTFKFVCTVGDKDSTHALKYENLRDALMVSAEITDIGGNPATAQGSWLVQSEELTFLRISSENEDMTYKATAATVTETTPAPERPIIIFLEFNKPVRLKSGVTSPVLRLNTGGEATYIGSASTMENTKQYFQYRVTSGQDTDKLNVTGMLINGVVGDAGWNTDTYPFSFVHVGEGDQKEEIRMVAQATGRNPTRTDYFTYMLPTRDTPGDGYIQTLYAGKDIKIDTTAPTISSITATPIGRHSIINGQPAEIYINVKFSEDVTYTTAPSLTFTTGGGRVMAGNAAAERLSGDTITFKYTVQAGDTTGADANVLQLASYTGTITDLSGTALETNAISSRTEANRNLANVRIDTIAPTNAPTVALWGSETGGAAVQVTAANMMYHDSLQLRFAAVGTAVLDRSRLEYTTNYDTATPANSTWNSVSVETNANFNLTVPGNGTYTVVVRQYDAAGNVSPNSTPMTFTWDKGPLVSRITADKPNGTYTNNASRGQEFVDITITFRKPIVITGGSFALNVTPAISPTIPNQGTGTVSSVTVRYNIATNHNTPGTTPLTLSNLIVTGTDNSVAITNTSPFISIPAGGSATFGGKEIFVSTGALTATALPAFASVTGGVTQGAQTDGSYQTNLTVTFNRQIQKGAGNVTVRQVATGYRLPSVLTEAQYNRFRAIDDINTYYAKGTNGYNDTSAKYVLDYQYDTANIGTDPDVVAFVERFRQAEGVSIPVTASQVRINNNNQLVVELTGSSALQVLGATYEITIPEGFVQDALGNQSPASSAMTVGGTTFGGTIAITGVAKPFIRIQKPTERISIQTGSDTQPSLYFTAQNAQALLTSAVRMDSRTPNAIIRFIRTEANTNVTGNNYNTTLTGNDPAQPALPGSATDNASTAYNGTITIGNTNYQGYQWRVRARAFTGAGDTAATQSDGSEEIANRTVLTYDIRNLPDYDGAGNPGQNMSAGDQIWIRGGDAVGSSNVPGFPLTWTDDYGKLKADGKRAGIRLLYMSAMTTNMNTNSTWRFVTWEVNVPVYYDMMLGRDNTSSDEDQVWQYGPLAYAAQRAGWTSFKERTVLIPGKHRWVFTNANDENKGGISFSAGFVTRPADL